MPMNSGITNIIEQLDFKELLFLNEIDWERQEGQI